MAAMPFLTPARECNFQISEYCESHRNQVLRLWVRNFEQGTEETFNLDIDRSRSADPRLFQVALHEDEVVGTCLGADDGYRCWIYYLCVAESVRRKGLGTQLLAKVEEFLKAGGGSQIGLHVRNRSAIAAHFYKAKGYCVEDTQCMGKRLR